jgi:hypothetical protein
MRFHVGPIPIEFTPDETWRPLKEPNPVLLQFFAVPVGMAVAAAVGYCWTRLGLPLSATIDSKQAPWALAGALLSFPLVIVVHELLHALVAPSWGRERATIIGVWPSHLLFYAHYSGALTRNRFLVIFATPFLVISILPLVLAALIPIPPVALSIAAWFSIWNALFACGDWIGFFLVLAQVPKLALVQNEGWKTFWKPSDASGSGAEEAPPD